MFSEIIYNSVTSPVQFQLVEAMTDYSDDIVDSDDDTVDTSIPLISPDSRSRIADNFQHNLHNLTRDFCHNRRNTNFAEYQSNFHN